MDLTTADAPLLLVNVELALALEDETFCTHTFPFYGQPISRPETRSTSKGPTTLASTLWIIGPPLHTKMSAALCNSRGNLIALARSSLRSLQQVLLERASGSSKA